MTAADPDPRVLPAGLRERVLAASLRARAVGRPVPDAPEIPPVEAFGRAASAFDATLCLLSDDDWGTPVLRGLDVQGLVGHLIGVEDDVQRALAGDPEVAGATTSSPPSPRPAARPAGRPAGPGPTGAPRSTAPSTWSRPADSGPRSPCTACGCRCARCWSSGPSSCGRTRTTSGRRSAGPPSVPDPSTLRLMTDLAARLLPLAGADP